MWSKPSRNSVDNRHSAYWLLLSVSGALLLLMAWWGQPATHVDHIGLSSGFNHPLTGWDHLLTMLAVGIWAAQLRGHAIWMLPLSFVGVMSLGGMAGAAGIDIPSVEGIILLSCAVFGVLITRKIRFNAKLNVLIVAFFGFFHGYAHGHEISASASLISYTLGFMLATLLLHGAGILVAKLVMLAITCLLTLLFSSTALANAHASNRDISQQSLSGGYQIGLQATAQFDSDTGFTVINHRATTLTASCATPPPTTAWLAIKPANIAATQPTGLINRSVSEVPSAQAHFKHYYPDINQTPGQSLSSNGVGLTSPPCCQLLTARAPALPPRFKRLFFSTEEPPHPPAVGLFTAFGIHHDLIAPHPIADRLSTVCDAMSAVDAQPLSQHPYDLLPARIRPNAPGKPRSDNNNNQPEIAL